MQIHIKKHLIIVGIVLVLGFLLISLTPVLIFTSPFWITTFLLIKYTPLKKPFNRYQTKAYDYLVYQSVGPKKFIWQMIYNLMCALYPQKKWSTMNYGYAILTSEGKTIRNLDPSLEEERFCLQLYHHVSTRLGEVKSLKGLNVLEVGSGRGGGLNYVSKFLEAYRCVGVDFSSTQIDFQSLCQGDSEKLSQLFGQGQFDQVINVESSHCYGNFKNFVQEVTNVLKPNGYFVIADFREAKEKNLFELDLQSSGLVMFNITILKKLIKGEDITLKVLQALKLDEKRKDVWIKQNSHFLLRPFFKKFSGMSDTRIFNELNQRKTLYLAYLLQKQN